MTVVADNCPNLDTEHFAKINYYSTITEMDQHSIPSSNIRFKALVLSWRGIFAPMSIADFLELCGSAQDLEFLVRLCVSEGASL